MSRTRIHVEKGRYRNTDMDYRDTSNKFKRHCERHNYEKGFDRNGRNTVMDSDLKKDFKSELREWDVIYDLDEDITSWLSNPPKKSKGNYGILYDYDRNFKKEITI